MKIWVRSRDNVLDCVNSIINDTVIVISITDPPPTNLINFPIPESRILRLQFHDIDRDYPGGGIIFFNKDMALSIKKFIHEKILFNNLLDCMNLVIHCEAGISRSSGTAAAIHQYLIGDPSDYFSGNNGFLPNRLVFKTLIDVLNGANNPIPKQMMPKNDCYINFFEDKKT